MDPLTASANVNSNVHRNVSSMNELNRTDSLDKDIDDDMEDIDIDTSNNNGTSAPSTPNASTNYSTPDSASPSSSTPQNKNYNFNILELRVKSFKDVDIQVPSDSLVSQVKENVRQALNETSPDKYVRLICKGRLLAPDNAPLKDFSVQNGDVIHAVIAAVKERDFVTSPSPSSSGTAHSSNHHRRRRRRRGNGIVVGPGGRVTRAPNEEQSNDDDDSSTSSSLDGADGPAGGGGGGDEETGNAARVRSSRRERRGLDRLRTTGMSRQEISVLRTYFSRHIERHIQQHPNVHDDEMDLRRRRWLYEEDWMAQQGPTSEFRLNLNQTTLLRFAAASDPSMAFNNWRSAAAGGGVGGAGTTTASGTLGTDRDFMWGFLMGFFVGFVMLVWVWMPTVPHKQKIGILTGISFQLTMNVLRQSEEAAASSSSGVNDFTDGN